MTRLFVMEAWLTPQIWFGLGRKCLSVRFFIFFSSPWIPAIFVWGNTIFHVLLWFNDVFRLERKKIVIRCGGINYYLAQIGDKPQWCRWMEIRNLTDLRNSVKDRVNVFKESATDRTKWGEQNRRKATIYQLNFPCNGFALCINLFHVFLSHQHVSINWTNSPKSLPMCPTLPLFSKRTTNRIQYVCHMHTTNREHRKSECNILYSCVLCSTMCGYKTQVCGRENFQ